MFAAMQNIDTTSKWLIIGAAGVTIGYAVLRPLKKKKDPLARQPFGQSLSAQRGLEREMSNLLVELSDMARPITAQPDTRAPKLQVLIKHADQKTHPPTSLTPERPSIQEFSPRSLNPIAPPPPDIDPRHADVYALA